MWLLFVAQYQSRFQSEPTRHTSQDPSPGSPPLSPHQQNGSRIRFYNRLRQHLLLRRQGRHDGGRVRYYDPTKPQDSISEVFTGAFGEKRMQDCIQFHQGCELRSADERWLCSWRRDSGM